MSMITTACPVCCELYTYGVVGSTVHGGHVCPVKVDRDRYRDALEEIVDLAEVRLKEAIEADYEPGDEDTADGLISSRFLIARCRAACDETHSDPEGS